MAAGIAVVRGPTYPSGTAPPLGPVDLDAGPETISRIPVNPASLLRLPWMEGREPGSTKLATRGCSRILIERTFELEDAVCGVSAVHFVGFGGRTALWILLAVKQRQR